MVIQKMNIIAIAQKMLLRKSLQPLIDSGVIGLTEKKAIEPESEVLYKIKYHRCSHHDHIGDFLLIVCSEIIIQRPEFLLLKIICGIGVDIHRSAVSNTLTTIIWVMFGRLVLR